MTSAFSVRSQNKTDLVPNSLVGNNDSQFLSITPGLGINFYDSVSTILASISWNGISTTNPNGFDILSKLNMNDQNIDNVNTINSTTGFDLTLASQTSQVNLTAGDSINLTASTGNITIIPTNAISTTLVPYGLYLSSSGTKTYPTTVSFNAYPLYSIIAELGTSQTYDTSTGFNFIYGDNRSYTKSAGTTSDIERLYFTGFQQSFNWTDANTCKQYVGITNSFSYNGINANGRTSSAFNADTISLICPSSSTQTIANITARNNISISATNANATYNITNIVSPNLTFSGTATNVIANITNHSFFENSTFWDSTWSGAGSLATITNMYGLRLNPPSGGTTTGLTITNNWGIYSGWSLAKNYFAGGVGIGTTTGTNALDVVGTVTATTFVGALTGTATNANGILTVSDNTATTCYIPFSKTTANTSTSLFVDDTTGPLTYNPSTSTLTASIFNGSATTAAITDTNINATYYPVFVTASGNTQTLRADIATNPLSYNPSTGLLTSTQLTIGPPLTTYDANVCCLFNANANPPSSLSGLVHYPFVFVGKDGERARLTIDSYSSGSFGSILTFRSAGGTAAAPTATTLGYQMANLSLQGYTNAGTRGAGITYAFLLANATAEWSPTVQSFYTTILTGTAGGTATTTRQRWYDDGGIQLGGTAAMSATSPGAGITLVSGSLSCSGVVSIGTTTPNSSAVLQVNSTTQGFLPPRMTGAQANAISTPAEGLMVYITNNTTAPFLIKGWWGYNGTTWTQIG